MMLARGRGRVFSPGKLSRLSLKPPDWRVKVRMLAVRESVRPNTEAGGKNKTREHRGPPGTL